MEVLPGIHRIEVPIADRILCLYLLAGRARTLLIDTGMDQTPRQHVVPYLDSIGLSTGKIDYALITHSDWDHQGGNVTLREIAPGALLSCHPFDRPLIESVDRLIEERYSEFQPEHSIDETAEAKAWIRLNNRSETPIDLTLMGGETIRLGEDWSVQVWHTPGHSVGHLSLYDAKNSVAIIADAVLGNCVPKRDGASALPPTYRYPETYLSTIHLLNSIPIQTMLTAHYPVFRGSEVGEFLAESRSFVERLELMLQLELSRARNPRTTRQLIGALTGRLGGWPSEAEVYLVFPLVGHLEALERRRSVEKIKGEGEVMWKRRS
jgi:glyoxylase-like metal-dependent hydrolase (beta-lactamase superfamily II)